MTNWLAATSICAVLAAAVGCRSDRIAPENRLDPQQQRREIESRAELVFANAIFLKPRETLPAADLTFTLAPLLMLEVASSNASAGINPATVYHLSGVIQIGGTTRPQMTYLWSHGNATTLTRGVRITLDSRGLPVIWEILSDEPGARVVFVSRSLEERAKAAFGLSAPGRTFAVEQPFRIAPDVVVARAIEDGPVAMGPIVHQTASGEINAVICRCMPTQARQLVATRYYELKPLSPVLNPDLEIVVQNRTVLEELRWPPGF